MRKSELTIVAALLVSATAYAQAPGPPLGPPGEARGPHGVFGRADLGFGHEMWKVVKGAPYSADISDQVVQTLADGNTIQRTTNGHIARDSQGRTYVQQTLTGGPLAQNGPRTVTFIADPIEGYSYVLNANTKTAMRRAIKTPAAGAKPPHPNRAFGPGEEAQGKSVNRVETELGTQNLNGVMATGKSVTHTIPAGEIGNAQPIVSTSETWYSSDLQIPILAKRTDPRSGQSIYSVTNIQRAEPQASLFQVPSDYKIQDANVHGSGGPRRVFRERLQ